MFKKGLVFTLILLPFLTAEAQISDFQINASLTGFDRVQQNFRLSENGENVYYTVGNDSFDGDRLFIGDTSTANASVLLNTSASTANTVASFNSENSDGSEITFFSSETTGLTAYKIASDGTNEIFIDDRFSFSPFLQGPVFGENDEVVFYAALTSINSGVNGLYTKGLAPSEVPARLDIHPNNDLGIDIGFRLTSDFKYLVYLASSSELYSVSVGGGSPIRLDENGVVSFFVLGEDNYKVSADGQTVVYRSLDQNTGTRHIYSISISGENRKLLSTETRVGGSVELFEITPDSENVIYITPSAASTASDDLFIVSIDGGQSRKLNGTLVPSGNVSDFAIGARGQKVIYRANQMSLLNSEFYSVAINEVSEEVRISPSAFSVSSLKLSPDGKYAAFTTDNGNSIIGLYLSDLVTGQSNEVLDGNSFRTPSNFEFSNLSDFLIFNAAQDDISEVELYAVSVFGGNPAKISRDFRVLDSDNGFGRRVGNFKIPSIGNRVVYRADIDRLSLSDIFSVDLSELQIEQENDELCLPIRARNGAVSVICL